MEALEEAAKCFERLQDYEQRITFAYEKSEALRQMRELLIPDSPAVLSRTTQAVVSGIQSKVSMWQNIASWQADTAKVRLIEIPLWQIGREAPFCVQTL